MNKPQPLVVIERAHIVLALQYTHGNVDQAAVLLDIGRSTLYRRIRDYKIEFEPVCSTVLKAVGTMAGR